MNANLKGIAKLVLFALISTIVCDNNVTTIESTTTTPVSTLSSTIQSTLSTVSSSTTSTRTPAKENSTKNPESSLRRRQFLNTTNYVCSCDLTFNCDVNCCCDLDCNAEIVEAFECSMGVEIDDYHYGEGLERCGVDNGLFCIAYDNVPAIDQKIHIPYHTEYSSYKWPKPTQFEHHHEINNELSSHDFYKFGDAIMTFDMKGEKYQTINIPALTIGDGSNCFLTEPVMFLKSKSIQCLRSYSDLCSYNNNLMSQLMHTQLFQRPPKSTSAQETSDVFSIVIETCKHTFNNCTQISSMSVGDRSINSKFHVEEIQEYFLYDDAYEDIQLTFHINDTKLLSATAKFGCRNELICNNNDELETTRIIQNIQIDFVNVNENRMERRIRKKTRGYSNDELIIASQLRPLNESIAVPTSSTEMIFDYFRNDTLENKGYFMRLPVITANGKCLMDDTHYDAVRFNENSQTLCTAELTRDLNSNFSICQQFQHQLMGHLFNTLNLTLNYTLDGYTSDIYISKFWTPRYEKSSWKRVSLYNVPLWSPDMQENEKTVTCSNLIVTANYKFFYSTVKASATRKYEHFIENLFIEFGKIDEIQFILDDENQTTQNVKIQINVQFINLFHKNNANAISMMMNNYVMISCILLASLTPLPFL